MGWPVVITSQAQRDLEQIVRYIARENPNAAERMGLALIQRAEMLGEQPRMGPPVRGWTQVRALLHRSYYIVYRCEEANRRLEVLRFWHSARDLDKLSRENSEE